MPTVVLNDEQADEKSGSGDSQEQGQPVIGMRHGPHGDEQGGKRDGRRDKLADADLRISSVSLEATREFGTQSDFIRKLFGHGLSLRRRLH